MLHYGPKLCYNLNHRIISEITVYLKKTVAIDKKIEQYSKT